MKYLPLKIWFMVTMTVTLVAVVIRAAWQIIVIPTAGTMSIFIPLILGLLGLNALIIYFTINPSLKKLKSPPVLIAVITVLMASLIGGIIHFNHYICSPEAEPLVSKVIATMLFLGSTSSYFLVIWVIRSTLKSRKNKHEQG